MHLIITKVGAVNLWDIEGHGAKSWAILAAIMCCYLWPGPGSGGQGGWGWQGGGGGHPLFTSHHLSQSQRLLAPANTGSHFLLVKSWKMLDCWWLCCKNVSGSNQYFPWQWMINNEWMQCQENSVGPVKNVPLIVFPLWCAVTMCCSWCREHILTRKHDPRTALCLTHLS